MDQADGLNTGFAVDPGDSDPMSFEGGPANESNITDGGQPPVEGGHQAATDGQAPGHNAADANAGGDSLHPLLVQQAVAAGLPVADAQRLTPAMFNLLMRSHSPQQADQAGQAGQAAPPQAHTGQAPPAFEWKKPDVSQVLGDDADPEFREVAEKLNDAYWGMFEHLHAEMTGVSGFVQQQQADAFVSEMDAYFADAKNPLFGEAGIRDLAQDANAATLMQNREQLAMAIDQVQSFRVAMGQQELPFRQAVDAALSLAFPGHVTNSAQVAARQRVTDQLRDDRGRFAAPANTSNSTGDSQLSPEERARRAVHQKLLAKGLA